MFFTPVAGPIFETKIESFFLESFFLERNFWAALLPENFAQVSSVQPITKLSRLIIDDPRST